MTNDLSHRTGDILSIEPRGMNRVKSAAYFDVGVGLFDEMVSDGRVSKPKKINSRLVWDRRKLDEDFDALPEDGEALCNPWEE